MADNYGMEVKASVKLPTSADIDKQIRKLEKSISKLQVSGKFEESTLKNLTNQLNTLKANIATASFSQDALQNLTNQINNALQGIQINSIGTGKQTQQVGQNVGKQLKENISSALRSGIDSSSIDDFAKRLKGIGVADSTIDETVKRLRELEYTVEKVKGKFSEKDGVVSLTGLDIVAKDGADTLNIVERLNQKTKEWKREIGVTTSFKEQQQEIRDTANEADRLATILTKVEKAKGKSTVANKMFGDVDGADDVKTSMRELERLLGEFDDTASLKDQELAWVKIDNAVKALNAGIEKYNQRNNTNTSVDDEAAKLEALAKRVQDVKSKFTTGADGKAVSDYQNRIQGLSDSFEKYGATSDITKAKIEQLKETLAGFRKEDGTFLDDEALDAQANKFEQEFKEIKIAVDQAKLAYDKFTQPVSKEKATTLINRINSFLTKNTAITQEAKAKLQGYVDELEKGVSLNRWNEINGALKETENSMRGLGKLGASLKNQMKQAAESFTQWLSVSSAIMLVIDQLRRMPRAVKELDDAITDFTMATGANKAQVESLIKTYGHLGDELSATVTDVTVSATEWLKQGKSIADTETLIRDSMVLSKVGKLSSADATKYLTSVMKSYNVSVADTLGIVDKLSAVDMASATDVGGLAEGISTVANNARLAGVSMDKLLGYLAAVGEVSQEGMSGVGTAYNAIFARMGNIKLSRLKDYETGEDLSNVETVLKGVQISLRDSQNSFRDFDEVLDETAGRWSTFSEVQQRAIANAFAGTHHVDSFITLMENYDNALKYSETSMDSSGQAMEKFAAYEDSLTGHTEKLENAFIQLSDNFLESDFLKFLTDVGTIGVKAINGLVSAFGSLGTIGIGAGIWKSFKNAGICV